MAVLHVLHNKSLLCKRKDFTKDKCSLWASGKGFLKHFSPSSLSDSFISVGRAWDGAMTLQEHLRKSAKSHSSQEDRFQHKIIEYFSFFTCQHNRGPVFKKLITAEVTVRHRFFFSDEEKNKPKVMRGEKKKEKDSKRIKPLAPIASAKTKQTHLQPYENKSSHQRLTYFRPCYLLQDINA